MSTLYIRLFSKTAADQAPHWHALACSFALVSNGNLSHGSLIESQGIAPLSDLADFVVKAQRVVILLAASDVNVLRLQVPPLPASKLKAALPNLVEDRLLADPADCVVAAGDISGGLRSIAVVQRAWLDSLASTFIAFGARRISALPAQLCLPYQSDQPGCVTAAINERDETDPSAGIGLTLRLTEQDGIGLEIAPEQNEAAASVAIRTLCAVVPEAPVTLYVPQSAVRAYQEVVNENVSLNKRISVFADNWSRWIAGASGTKLDLMAGLGAGTRPVLDWRPWRLPLALAAVVLIINAVALNIDWWSIKSEANTQRAAMIQIYKAAYPKESVIIDPVAQMQQKIATARHDSGMASPDDFTAIIAAFGDAWSGAATDKERAAAIAALDYHERRLFVRLKPGVAAPTQQMKTALAKYELALDLAPEQSGSIIWEIRSMK